MADVHGHCQTRENVELDFQRSRARHISSGSGNEIEDEALDPRVQEELEKLNHGSDDINRLELELDDARSTFRQTLSDSTQKLNTLTKKLGSCIEKARPYYDARMRAKEAQVETQRAALRFERAMSMHEAAKEMVQLAEQGYMNKGEPFDPAWQEMLNHATMKVNEAEKERIESEQEHQLTAKFYNEADQRVQFLQKELKRAITKSRPYFEMKGKFNQLMEEQKQYVAKLEAQVVAAKSMYSEALRNLESISDDIHRQRMERRKHKELGIRSAGVGAESPAPPPMREGGVMIEGSDKTHPDTQMDSPEIKTGSHEDGDMLSPVLYRSPESARNNSYRQAIDASMSKSPTYESINSADYDENFDVPSLEDEYMALPPTQTSQGKSVVQSFPKTVGSIPEENDSVFPSSPNTRAAPSKDYVSDVRSSSPSSSMGSPSGTRKAKLQGIILKIDSSMDGGLRHPSFKPPKNSVDVCYCSSLLQRARNNVSQKTCREWCHKASSVTTNEWFTVSPILNNGRPSGVGEKATTENPAVMAGVTASPVKKQATLCLPRPASSQDLEDNSDTESIASTGPMLDDELVEMATLELPDEEELAQEENEFRQRFKRDSWRRRSLPPHLSYLANYLPQQPGDSASLESLPERH
ncbi:LOW QUALITY PROTEIN: uncharacterized protein LOC135482412 [Liolophura sinensis]|uniref:LOW QUALITY PROTEIN: uncharacterized protein LOC135482412 n=1 Tax=Liolophura sinensis TaxID=3198878 RepID=UPI00315947E8